MRDNLIEDIQERNLSDDHITVKSDGSHVVREKWSKSIANREVLRVRKWFKMRSINSGIRKCVKCDHDFESEDVKTIRMCTPCKRTQY